MIGIEHQNDFIGPRFGAGGAGPEKRHQRQQPEEYTYCQRGPVHHLHDDTPLSVK